MLVLGRKLYQTVIIGTEPNVISICICEISGGTVRLGISAPDDVPIYRGEKWNQPKKESSNGE